jgi:hypothetical protein
VKKLTNLFEITTNEEDDIDYVDLILTCFIALLYVMLLHEFYKMAIKYFSCDSQFSDKIDTVIYNYISLDDDRSYREKHKIYFDSY